MLRFQNVGISKRYDVKTEKHRTQNICSQYFNIRNICTRVLKDENANSLHVFLYLEKINYSQIIVIQKNVNVRCMDMII